MSSVCGEVLAARDHSNTPTLLEAPDPSSFFTNHKVMHASQDQNKSSCSKKKHPSLFPGNCFGEAVCVFCYCKSPLYAFQGNILLHSLIVIVLLSEKDPFPVISKSIVGQVCAVASQLLVAYRQLSATDCSRNESCKLTCVLFCSQMKSPGITTSLGGKNKTLYMQTVKSIEERTRQNLKKTLKGIFLEVALWT